MIERRKNLARRASDRISLSVVHQARYKDAVIGAIISAGVVASLMVDLIFTTI